MSARAEDAGSSRPAGFGPIEQCGHEVTRETLEDQLLHDITIPVQPAGRLRRRWGCRRRQTIEQPQERLAQLPLEGLQLGSSHDTAETLAASRLLPRREIEQLTVEVGDRPPRLCLRKQAGEEEESEEITAGDRNHGCL